MVEYDGYGRPVPAGLAEVFAGREELLRWCRGLRLLRQELRGWRDRAWMAGMDVERIDRLLVSATTLVTAGMPFERCDCDPTERDCPKCQGRRWINAVQMLSGPARHLDA